MLRFYLNSVCLNLNLSDTLLNIYRDINFDSCTLCVCNNNNIYGLDNSIYILNDVFDTMNEMVVRQPHKPAENGPNQPQNPHQITPNQSLMINHHANMTNTVCTCGFSSVVNRSILAKSSMSINLNLLLKLVDKLNLPKHDKDLIVPYYNLVSFLNSKVNKSKRDEQVFILNSTNCSGLFLEDYNEILNISQPHYLINSICSVISNNKPVSSSQIANKIISNVVTSKFLKSVLVRENYAWKKSFTFRPQAKKSSTKPASVAQSANTSLNQQSPNKKLTKKQLRAQELKEKDLKSGGKKPQENKKAAANKKLELNLIDEKLKSKRNGEYELVPENSGPSANILDMFDQKYSCPFLSVHESFDIFYSSGKQFDFDDNYSKDYDQLYSYDDDETEYLEKSGKKQKLNNKKYYKHFKLSSLNQFDENNVCKNVVKRLYLKSKASINEQNQAEENSQKLKNSTFNQSTLHSWVYSKKDLKSNLELTKSLKLIQPLLEETVQKKYTTSRMWESFQGPLTWQHFCRLAFRDSGTGGSSSINHNSHHSNAHAHHSQSQMNSSNSASSTSNSSSNSQSQHNCYEPEPIPALLVSSSEKDWLTVSPYSIKFWDKLNFEPYSKQKHVAYIVLMPDFSELFNELNETSSSIPTPTASHKYEDSDIFGFGKSAQAKQSQEKEMSDAQFQTMYQSVKDYFKELNSVYELCRLGIHRPALRIAPDQGFIKVPLNRKVKKEKEKEKEKTAPPVQKQTSINKMDDKNRLG